MQDYLNQHEMWKLDIEEVNGMYSDNQMILKIIRGLTTRLGDDPCWIDPGMILSE
jgi:hypothetical protein